MRLSFTGIQTRVFGTLLALLTLSYGGLMGLRRS